MRLLGAIVAGGRSRRFGDDKAATMVHGHALIDRVYDALAPQVEAMVVCGRAWRDMTSLADQPRPDMGPLGGLCAALHHAVVHRYDAVLTAGCDTLPVPDMSLLDGSGPAVISGHHLFGFWPVDLSAQLDAHLAASQDLSIRRWLTACGARRLAPDTQFYNMNTPDDLKRFSTAEEAGD